jgi:energy-coupling factor transporter ATP-binding protein EcfA2
MAFASPLYKFTGHSGIIFNMVGEKGSGKSTVLKVIASVWMKPEEQLLKESDTVNSAEVILGAMHNLPVMYDEITNIDDKKLSDLCYNITQGRGRNRLHSNASLKANTATWALVMCSSSNLSLVDKLSQQKANSSAEAIRVFEIRVDGNVVIDKTMADAAFRKLERNYGTAGDVYAKYLVENKDAVVQQLEDAIIQIDRELGIKSPERFWSALLACVMVGGEIAKSLGLHRYDMDKLYAWSAKHIASMRTNVEEKTADPLSVLGNFFASKIRNTIVIVQGKLRDSLMPHLRDTPQIRIEVDPGAAVAFIEVKALTDYCKFNNVSLSWWETRMRNMGILVETNKSKRLTAGCNDLPSISVKTWVLNLTKQEFREDIERIITGQEAISRSLEPVSKNAKYVTVSPKDNTAGE